MKDWHKATIIYACSFFIAHALMILVAKLTNFIDNPDASLSELLFTAVFMISAMVVFDKIVIKR